jgi:hypothetical protein
MAGCTGTLNPDAGQDLMNRKVPEQIVHYSRGEPFRTITSVSPDQLDHVISSLDERNAWGLDRFVHTEYLKQRALVVEAHLWIMPPVDLVQKLEISPQGAGS